MKHGWMVFRSSAWCQRILTCLAFVLLVLPAHGQFEQNSEQVALKELITRIEALAERTKGSVLEEARAAVKVLSAPLPRESRRARLKRVLDDGAPFAAEIRQFVGADIAENDFLQRPAPFRSDFTTCLEKVVTAALEQSASQFNSLAEQLARLRRVDGDLAEPIKAVVVDWSTTVVLRSDRNTVLFGLETCDYIDGGDLPPGLVSAKAAVALNDYLSTKWDQKCYVSDPVVNEPRGGPLSLPSVGGLLFKDPDRSSKNMMCSATLIAPNMVLTAGHCFCQTGAKQPGGRFYRDAATCAAGTYVAGRQVRSALDPTNHSVFFQHAGSFNVERVILHPRYSWRGRLPRADLAVLVLDRAVVGIEPTPINTFGRILPGLDALAAGYGFHRPLDVNGKPLQNSDIRPETGLKFRGAVVTQKCSFNERLRGMVCWTARENLQEKFLGRTCNGDSGGPIFAKRDGKDVLIGVTAAGGRQCEVGSRSHNFSTFRHRGFIQALIARYGSPRSRELSKVVARQKRCVYCVACGLNRFSAITLNPRAPRDLNIKLGALKFGYGTMIIPNDVGRATTMRVSANCSSLFQSHPVTLDVKIIDPAPGYNRVHESKPTDSAVPVDPAGSITIDVPSDKSLQVLLTGLGSLTRECQIMATDIG